MGLGGHLWTIAPLVAHRLAATRAVAAERWSTTVDDPRLGPVRLTGRLAASGRDDALVVLVHGLGGANDSHYVQRMARAAAREGLATLALNLRGADRSGEDWYHAGLASDLAAVVADPSLARFARVAFVGFSLGGHVVLRLAADGAPARVAACAAICPPLDLARGARAIDAPVRRPYLAHVLGGLVETYERVAARREVPIPVPEARRIRSLVAWDDRVVAPRFGFRDADHYYAEASVGPRLGRVEAPTLVVVGDDDPMIPLETVTPSLRGRSRAVDARVVRGGHVGFPASMDLGLRAPRGLEPQVLAWLRSRLGA